MKKSLGFVVLVLFAVSSARPVQLQIKIGGGLGYYNLKDINHALKSWEEYLNGVATTTPSWNFQGGGVRRFQSGVELEGELLFSLTPRLYFSLGSGYMYGELSPEKTELSILQGLSTYVYVHPEKVSARPVVLAGYYFLPLAKKLSLFFRAGGGYVWAKYISREGYKRLPNVKYTYSSSLIAEGRGTIFQAGLGLTYEFDPAVSLFFEAAGRQARASGFGGEISTGVKGKLYFYEEYNPVLKIWQAKVQLWDSTPAGENYRSAHEAIVDFNGFYLKIGIMIRF